ncbi:MAG: FAD-dependent oxidoreductase, partial [Rhodococcus sp. (in: high G+C Gram-positive bacteria)]|uniref:NAD(P)/FAD-dependent oxidoreductase n=1 Tax=Rhodococcus sp. TaxID=1831 RepID=UPI003BAEE503
MTAHVVVVGAGYAGVMAANRVASVGVADVVVTVINPRRDFVERIRLHQCAAGSGAATVPLADLLHHAVRLRVAAVDAIGERSVTLNDGQVVGFDFLIYAVGSGADRQGFEQGDVGAVTGLGAAERLHARLRALPAGARIVVVGGGLTGIETSAEIAEQFPRLRLDLVTNTVAASMSAGGRAVIERTLSALGVSVRGGLTVTGVRAGGVDLRGNRVLFGDCTIWAGSFTVPGLARRSGLPVDRLGRLRTDESLVCVGHPRIVGIGDAAAPPQSVAGHVRMSCQASIPMGAHGANTVLALLDGRKPSALSVGFVGQAVSLGRRRGLIQITRLDDSPRALAIRGRSAAAIKEVVC